MNYMDRKLNHLVINCIILGMNIVLLIFNICELVKKFGLCN